MTIELLDNQVAARLTAECRDRDKVERLQRAAYIVETLLEGMGFGHTMKELRKIRVAIGDIHRECPDETPDALMPPFLSRARKCV